jgi:glycosyltransferase involved in cell wall biosynthesis
MRSLPVSPERLDDGVCRLAVVVSHPIQYYAPWFATLSQLPNLVLHVFHLWDFGVVEQRDAAFGLPIRWDLPLLQGYESSFVPNRSADPGTHHLKGLNNPGLVAALRRWRPDAVLVFGYASLSHLRLLIDPRLWGVPLLFRGDSHDLARGGGWREGCSAIVRSLLFRRFAMALAVGQANAAYLARHGMGDRLAMAPHCVDNSRFRSAAAVAEAEALQWRERLGIPSAAPVVLFAGKFEAKKRPLDLLEAFAAMHHPTAVLVLVGAGRLEPELRRRAEQLPVGRVIVQGFQNQRAMPRTYALGDVLVLPSFGNGETWGLAVNEAMNLARPVIVSDHVGCAADLVLPGRTGWVFPAGDRDALRRCLDEALADSDRLGRMGREAQQHVASFSYEAATGGLLQALRRLGRLPAVPAQRQEVAA